MIIMYDTNVIEFGLGNIVVGTTKLEAVSPEVNNYRGIYIDHLKEPMPLNIECLANSYEHLLDSDRPSTVLVFHSIESIEKFKKDLDRLIEEIRSDEVYM